VSTSVQIGQKIQNEFSAIRKTLAELVESHHASADSFHDVAQRVDHTNDEIRRLIGMNYQRISMTWVISMLTLAASAATLVIVLYLASRGQ
jgi:hypothetical protein